jgi:hypothetical protein
MRLSGRLSTMVRRGTDRDEKIGVARPCPTPLAAAANHERA